MEQQQKQRHVEKRKEEVIEPLPDPIDESELLEETEKILGKIAVALEENND